MKKSLLLLTALFSSTVAMAQTTSEQNKANVLAFYDLAFAQHKPQEAVDKYVGKEYLQNNPRVAGGGQAFVSLYSLHRLNTICFCNSRSSQICFCNSRSSQICFCVHCPFSTEAKEYSTAK